MSNAVMSHRLRLESFMSVTNAAVTGGANSFESRRTNDDANSAIAALVHQLCPISMFGLIDDGGATITLRNNYLSPVVIKVTFDLTTLD